MAQRQSYRILLLKQPYLALRSKDLMQGERPLAPAVAWHLVRRELLQPSHVNTVRNLWNAIARNGSPGSSFIRLPIIQNAFESAAWVLVPQGFHGELTAPPPAEMPADEQIRVAKVVKTWIEMEVVDDFGHPLCGQAYVCMLPDGTLEHGKLDSKGRVRFDGIDPGNCVFSLTELDRETWERM